jgi:methylaspartate ammonia-lyase
VSKLVACDKAIGDCTLAGHAFDIISFDFKSAFDKVPHNIVIEALADKGVYGSALRWFGDFLSNRTQRVRVGNYLSTAHDVISGVIQSSVRGPSLYVVVADLLLRRVKLTATGFVFLNFKFVADVACNNQQEVQVEIDKVIS